MKLVKWALLGLIVASMTGCTGIWQTNPAFSLTSAQTRAQWERMEANPGKLERPLVLLGGWRQPPPVIWALSSRLQKLTGADESQVLAVSHLFGGSIDEIARSVSRQIDEKWPSDEPNETIEVDIVGFSMGGIVARAAARRLGPGKNAKRVKIRRLFTISAPHKGAKAAWMAYLDPAAHEMRANSRLMSQLNAELKNADFELVCYAHLNDVVVGATNTAPDGMQPIWLPGTLLASHFTAISDKRILADIACRLRGEEPLAEPGPPPPRD